MAAIGKLKDRARKHEQKEDWQSAIQAYREVLEKEDESEELEVELSLYNRIGDLHLRLGQTHEAVSYYETAADKYAESGFFNNAIALCNKALRHQPDRPEIYLKLSGLCAEQGFQTDARRWILEYSERQMKAGRVEKALTGLENFADLSDDPEIRETLAHQLVAHDRPNEAVGQLRHAYLLRARNGEDAEAAAALEQARQIDPTVDFEADAAAHEWPEPAATDDWGDSDAIAARGDHDEAAAAGLDGLETRPEEPVEPEPADVGLDGLETTAAEAADPDEADTEPGALSGLQLSHSEQEPAAPPAEEDAAALGGLETFDDGAGGEEDAAELEELEELEDESEDEPEPLPLLDTGYDDEDVESLDADEDGEPEPLPLLDTGFDDEPDEESEPESEEELAGEPASLEASEASSGAMDLDLGSFDLGMGFKEEADGVEDEDTDVDVETVLQRGRDLVGRGLMDQALLELRVLSGRSSDMEVVHEALAIVNEIVREEANHIGALQRRVEYSALTGERDLLIRAYLDMADALARLGAETKAQAMYERVLAMDPESEEAREALGTPVEEEEETIDLDAVLREMKPEEIAERAERAGAGAESDPSFAAMLSQFKAKVTDRPDHSDNAGDHYDLGLAFKEMGLIDEAIAEFQTALTGGTERLKVYEELGQCFIQKGQYNVAFKVLTRALQVPHADDTELLGVYYHLGQCHEELGQRAEAREAYEKVLALNEGFKDVPERMARL